MSFKETIAKENSVLKPLLPVRYLISLMGLFACFCGFIYNDMMSLTLDFGTCYNLESSGTTQYITRQPDCVYLFGIKANYNIYLYIYNLNNKYICLILRC